LPMSVADPPIRVEPSLIYLDTTGKPRIVGTGIKVRIVAEWFNAGHTPEQLKAAWPHAPLAGIYSAIAYYLDHKRAIDEEIAHLKTFGEALGADAEETPGRKKLRDMGLRP
jgi:uncharacterized protein (DUF433 family)